MPYEDLYPALGLKGNPGSVGYMIEDIERHLHSYERWMEKAALPTGETHVADAIGSGSGAFQIDAGNNDWGAWTQIIGGEDLPRTIDGSLYYIHRVLIVASQHTDLYAMQIAFGDTGAQGLASDEYVEIVYKSSSVIPGGGFIEVNCERQDKTNKAWARCICAGKTSGTLDFVFGLHEFEG